MYFIYLDGASAGDINPTVLLGQASMKTTNSNSDVTFTSAKLSGSSSPLVASHDNLNKT